MTTILKETLKALLLELEYDSVQEKDGMIAFTAETDYLDYVIVVDELKSNKDILNFAVMPMIDGTLVTLPMLKNPQLSTTLMLQMNSKEKLGSWALDLDVIYWSVNVKINNWIIELEQLKDTLTIIYNEVSLEIEGLLEPRYTELSTSSENEDDVNEYEEIPEEQQNIAAEKDILKEEDDIPLPPITESKSQW